MVQYRRRILRYCLWLAIAAAVPLHFRPRPLGPPIAAAAVPARSAPRSSSALIINPNNPSSVRSFTWDSSDWRFQAGTDDGFGDWHLTRNGIGTGDLFQVAVAGDSLYGYNLKTTMWYRWSGSSWSPAGSAPPFVSGRGVPFLLGASCCSANGADLPWTGWLGRTPDYADNGSGSGTNAYFVPGVELGAGRLPGDLAYSMVGFDSKKHCVDPNGQTYASLATVLHRIAAGSYDEAINGQIQRYLVPIVRRVYFIRISREWPGNWYCDSPWYDGSEHASAVSPVVWVAAWRHVHDLLKARLPNVKFEWDGPSDALQAAYYPGDRYVDLIGTDDYVGEGATNDSAALADWSASLSGQGGRLNLGYLLTFQQQRNKPIVIPEWADHSSYSSTLRTGNPVITQFVNLFASLSLGPGNATLVAQSYWDNDAACSGCGLGDYTGKRTAYAQPWPNGFANTRYSGSYWKLLPMPGINFWRSNG